MTFSHTHSDLYVLTTFKCNCKCEFCGFRHVRLKSDPRAIVGKVDYVLSQYRGPFAVKITGGEPLLNPTLVSEILTLCNAHKNIRNIGVGTNGTLPADVLLGSRHPVHLYVSRHSAGDHFRNALPLSEFTKLGIPVGLNCNLIAGGVDSVDKMIEYIDWALSWGIGLICFRELNHLSIDNTTMYDKFVYEYLRFYEQKKVSIRKIMEEAIARGFKHSHTVTSKYDENHNFTYRGAKIRFRKVDEEVMLERVESGKFIEYVVHPDGLLTGSWDREANVISR